MIVFEKVFKSFRERGKCNIYGNNETSKSKTRKDSGTSKSQIHNMKGNESVTIHTLNTVLNILCKSGVPKDRAGDESDDTCPCYGKSPPPCGEGLNCLI